jgi:hypothetical protein
MSSSDIHNQQPSQEDNEIKRDLLVEYAEVLIDSIKDGGIFSEIPLLKTATSAHKLISLVRTKRFQRQMEAFLDEIRLGKFEDKAANDFRNQFEEDEHFRDRVMNHLVEQIDEFDEELKAKILARLFISLTNNYIEWRRFIDLSSSLKRAHYIALGILNSQSIHSIPPDQITSRTRYEGGVGIGGNMEGAVLLESCGLAYREIDQKTGKMKTYLTGLGIDMLICGVKPNGPWKECLVNSEV